MHILKSSNSELFDPILTMILFGLFEFSNEKVLNSNIDLTQSYAIIFIK